MPLSTDVGLGPGDTVLDGGPVLHQRGHNPPPIFGPCLLHQTAVCIRIPLGMEVGLSLGDIVLDRDPAPLP